MAKLGCYNFNKFIGTKIQKKVKQTKFIGIFFYLHQKTAADIHIWAGRET